HVAHLAPPPKTQRQSCLEEGRARRERKNRSHAEKTPQSVHEGVSEGSESTRNVNREARTKTTRPPGATRRRSELPGRGGRALLDGHVAVRGELHQDPAAPHRAVGAPLVRAGEGEPGHLHLHVAAPRL